MLGRIRSKFAAPEPDAESTVGAAVGTPKPTAGSTPGPTLVSPVPEPEGKSKGKGKGKGKGDDVEQPMAAGGGDEAVKKKKGPGDKKMASGYDLMADAQDMMDAGDALGGQLKDMMKSDEKPESPEKKKPETSVQMSVLPDASERPGIDADTASEADPAIQIVNDSGGTPSTVVTPDADEDEDEAPNAPSI